MLFFSRRDRRLLATELAYLRRDIERLRYDLARLEDRTPPEPLTHVSTPWSSRNSPGPVP